MRGPSLLLFFAPPCYCSSSPIVPPCYCSLSLSTPAAAAPLQTTACPAAASQNDLRGGLLRLKPTSKPSAELEASHSCHLLCKLATFAHGISRRPYKLAASASGIHTFAPLDPALQVNAPAALASILPRPVDPALLFTGGHMFSQTAATCPCCAASRDYACPHSRSATVADLRASTSRTGRPRVPSASCRCIIPLGLHLAGALLCDSHLFEPACFSNIL